ncbi:MAG: ATP-dependent metallopeptidase FtsH/Yme1/Tma family protein [Lachnospiraceae bacterium]|nr:ATP-dependent metallopeptidase FtsH/Yme1/Tma family protein [Lachnospiraceae bacterium]
MKSSKGFGIYFALIIVMIFVVYLSKSISESNYANINYQDFVSALKGGRVSSVVLIPSEDVPTGLVRLVLDKDTKAKFYCSDVTEIEQLLRDANIRYTMEEVEKPGWFLTSVLPYILIGIVLLVFMFMMTGQGS